MTGPKFAKRFMHLQETLSVGAMLA